MNATVTHHREHRVVGAIGAKVTDQIAEPLPRYDQLGTHQQDERERERRANAVEQFRQRARCYHVPHHAQARGRPCCAPTI